MPIVAETEQIADRRNCRLNSRAQISDGSSARCSVVPRGHVLGDEFAELPELDERSGRIVEKIPLDQGRQTGEPLILRGEKVEVAGHPHLSQSLFTCPQTSSSGCVFFAIGPTAFAFS